MDSLRHLHAVPHGLVQNKPRHMIEYDISFVQRIKTCDYEAGEVIMMMVTTTTTTTMIHVDGDICKNCTTEIVWSQEKHRVLSRFASPQFPLYRRINTIMPQRPQLGCTSLGQIIPRYYPDRLMAREGLSLL